MGHLSQEQKLWAGTRHSTWRSFCPKDLPPQPPLDKKPCMHSQICHQDTGALETVLTPWGLLTLEGWIWQGTCYTLPEGTYMKEEVFLESQSQPNGA